MLHRHRTIGPARPPPVPDATDVTAPLVTCPECGSANPEGSRFCNSCGARVGAASTSVREERRTVTVLFADLASFTARAESLDPEDVRAFLVPYYDVLTAEVTAYGGRVDRFLGDGIMAVFGAPRAHEDDPERAVRAALRIAARIPVLGLDLHVRLGVNTGEVLYTPASSDERDDAVTGDTVNTAARLQAAAPADGVVVGEATWRATAHVIRYAALPPVVAKGKREPVSLWHALEPIARVGGDPSEERTPFVGRHRELDTLIATFERSRSTPTFETVTIVAEPGLGKSRLVRELARHIDALPDLVTWRVGRCLPYGEGIGFWALGEIVRAQAGILDTDDRETRSAKLEAVLVEPDPALRRWMADRLAPLVGLTSATEPPTADEAFAAWRRFLVSVAAAGPAVLVVEDLHWADAALVSFLVSLADEAAGLPLLIVATARPEIAERYSGWLAQTAAVPLAPLSDADIGTLLAAALPGSPPHLLTTVLARAAGSPLYAEQLAAMVRDRPDPAALADRDVPVSLVALLASRIDALPAAARALLRDAAVVGTTFWSEAVASMREWQGVDLAPVLADLVRRDLIRPEAAPSMTDAGEYVFVHALLRDVAYAELPRGVRLARHRAVAAWITERAGPALGERAEIVVHHLQRALELATVTGTVGDLAPVREELVTATMAAAMHAMGSVPARAADHLRVALDLMGDDEPRRAEALARLGWSLVAMLEYPEAARHLDEARVLLLARGDAVLAAGIATPLAVALANIGEARRAVTVLAEARGALAERPGPTLLSIIGEQAMMAARADRREDALSLAGEAISLAETLMLAPPPRAMMARGMWRMLDDPDAGIADMRTAIALAQAAGDVRTAFAGYYNLAISLPTLDAQLAGLDDAVAFSLEHGLPAVMPQRARLWALFAAARWDGLPEALMDVSVRAAAIGDAMDVLDAECELAEIRLERGEPTGPLDDLIASCRRQGLSTFTVDVLLARAAIVDGDLTSARGSLEAALAPLAAAEAIVDVAHFVRACLAVGDPGLAREGLARASRTPEPGPAASAELAAAAALIAEADGKLDEARAGFKRALDGWTTLGWTLPGAYALADLGRCLLGLGERDEGIARLCEARELWVGMKAVPRIAEIDALLAAAE